MKSTRLTSMLGSWSWNQMRRLRSPKDLQIFSCRFFVAYSKHFSKSIPLQSKKTTRNVKHANNRRSSICDRRPFNVWWIWLHKFAAQLEETMEHFLNKNHTLSEVFFLLLPTLWVAGDSRFKQDQSTSSRMLVPSGLGWFCFFKNWCTMFLHSESRCFFGKRRRSGCL